MKTALEALHMGTITWDAFFRATDRDWKRLANHVRRRWRAPSSVDAEDVEQELKLGAVKAAKEWKPDRAPFPNFVVWTATNRATKWLHTQRKALRRDGRAPSRLHVSFCEFEHDPEVAEDALQDMHADQFERIAMALERLDELGQHVFVAILLAKGDLDGAAEDVYDDADLRRVLRLDGLEHARRIVRRVAASSAALMAA